MLSVETALHTQSTFLMHKPLTNVLFRTKGYRTKSQGSSKTASCLVNCLSKNTLPQKKGFFISFHFFFPESIKSSESE